MQNYNTEEKEILHDYTNFPLMQEIQLSPTKISELECGIVLMGDCPSCPQCACIRQDYQSLAIIEAPATVLLMVAMGAKRIAS